MIHSANYSRLPYRGKGQWTMACALTMWLFLFQTSSCLSHQRHLAWLPICLLHTPSTSSLHPILLPNFTVNLRPHLHIVPPHSASRYQNMRQAGVESAWGGWLHQGVEGLNVISLQQRCAYLYGPTVHRTQRQTSVHLCSLTACSVHGTEETFSKVCWITELGLRSFKDNSI